MNRSILTKELKSVGISLSGWMPVLQCDSCKHRRQPFNVAVATSSPTWRFDYWRCPNRCNAKARTSPQVQSAIPPYVQINDIPGMIFDDEDLPAFEQYVRSMEMTQVPNRST